MDPQLEMKPRVTATGKYYGADLQRYSKYEFSDNNTIIIDNRKADFASLSSWNFKKG
jgi:hypothetical protein